MSNVPLSDLGVSCDIHRFRKRLNYTSSTLDGLVQCGQNYIKYESSFFLLDHKDQKHQIDMINLVALILSKSKSDTQYAFAENVFTAGFLLEGTNLYFRPNNPEIRINYYFKKGEHFFYFNDARCALVVSAGFVTFESHTSIDGVEILNTIENKALFFLESEHQEFSYELVPEDKIHEIEKVINDGISFLKSEKSLITRAFIDRQIHYISLTDVDIYESSSDPRHAKGLVTVNLREKYLSSHVEKTAWFIQAIVHESKHLQFFDLFLGQNKPSVNWIMNADIQLTTDWGVKVPCSWRGDPSLRSMTDHLLALQAFVPGLVALLNYLDCMPSKIYSRWFRDHIEMEMRVINGAIGVLILGQSHLTKQGHSLFEIIQHDYMNYLVPLLHKVNPQIRYE